MMSEQDGTAAVLAALLPFAGNTGHFGESVVADRLARAIEAAVTMLGVDSVGLMLLDEEDQLQPVGFSDGPAAQLETAQAVVGVGPGIDAVERGTIIVVPDLAREPAYASLWSEVSTEEIRAVLSVPLTVRNEVVGNFNAARTTAHDWTKAEISATEACAAVVGLIFDLTGQASASTEQLNRLQTRWGIATSGNADPFQKENPG